MLESERVAIAARLHVALRRKVGRVTDTEWMAHNVEYATEMVRFARAHAQESHDVELGDIATRLEEVGTSKNPSADATPANATITA